MPGLTGDTCGQLLLGVGQEVFERSAFVGQGAPGRHLRAGAGRRIAALVSSGEEDVSFSQAEGQLREWLNRRKVNKSVGLIPRLEGELAETGRCSPGWRRPTGPCPAWRGKRRSWRAGRLSWRRSGGPTAGWMPWSWTAGTPRHGRIWRLPGGRLTLWNGNRPGTGALPEREELKRAQGELQYLKVLEEEIRQGEGALREAEEAYEQARREALDDRFNGMSGEEAVSRAAADGALLREALERARREKRRFPLLLSVGLALLVLSAALGAVLDGSFLPWLLGGAACCGALALAAVLALRRAGRASAQADQVLARYRAGSGERSPPWRRTTAAGTKQPRRPPDRRRWCGRHWRTGKPGGRTAGSICSPLSTPLPRRCPTCLAAPPPSRALNLEERQGLARTRLEGARRLFDELAAQGGQALEAMPEGLTRPERPPEETEEQLAAVTAALERVERLRSMALGSSGRWGPRRLAACREELQGSWTGGRRSMRPSASPWMP